MVYTTLVYTTANYGITDSYMDTEYIKDRISEITTYLHCMHQCPAFFPTVASFHFLTKWWV